MARRDKKSSVLWSYWGKKVDSLLRTDINFSGGSFTDLKQYIETTTVAATQGSLSKLQVN